MAPGFIGLLQVNVRVPANVPSGTQPVRLRVGGGQSRDGVTIFVQ
jgi:uncharacterized protein (TIGR03437 family)